MPKCRNLTETIVLLNTDDEALSEWRAVKGDDVALRKFRKAWHICQKAMNSLEKVAAGGESDADIKKETAQQGVVLYRIIRS